MSEDLKKEMIYFLDEDIHAAQLQLATDDKMVTLSHLHDYTAPDAKNDPEILKDLCEYVILLEGFISLLGEIENFPTIPSEDESNMEFVITMKELLLLKFYLPMMGTFERKIRSHGFSLGIH
jgi:hypothetical protein